MQHNIDQATLQSDCQSPSHPSRTTRHRRGAGDVDALLAGLDQLIAKKRDLKQAAMQQLLTGQQRLPGFSGEWEVKQSAETFAKLMDYADELLKLRHRLRRMGLIPALSVGYVKIGSIDFDN